MANIIKIDNLLILLLLTLTFKCSDPVSTDEVDQRLIGEWYLIDTLHYSYPTPELSFYGIQINNDKNVKLLGIEISTGKVAIWKDDYKTIIRANQEILVLLWFSPPNIRTDTCTYRLENEKLIIENDFSTLILTKTRLGKQIFEPIYCTLSFKADSTTFENEKISDCPSAFTSKKSSSEFFLRSSMNNSYLEIDINEFNGLGSYEIPFEKGRFTIWYGDAGAIYYSDSLSTGNITITEYDEINNSCSGTFYFTAIGPGQANIETKEIKEGLFTIPIYK